MSIFGIFKRKYKNEVEYHSLSSKHFIEAIKKFELNSDKRSRKNARSVIIKRRRMRGLK